MKKHVPFFALVLIFALVFAGCDAQPNSPSQAVASVTTPPTLQTWEGYTAPFRKAIRCTLPCGSPLRRMWTFPSGCLANQKRNFPSGI